jgi:hypothetical protein
MNAEKRFSRMNNTPRPIRVSGAVLITQLQKRVRDLSNALIKVRK